MHDAVYARGMLAKSDHERKSARRRRRDGFRFCGVALTTLSSPAVKIHAVRRRQPFTVRRHAALSRTLSNVTVIGCKGIDSMTRST
jgi:hypothetical protein